MVKTPGTINGGFYQKTEDTMSHAPSFVISVADIKSAMSAVESSEGKTPGAKGQDGQPTMETMMIPGIAFGYDSRIPKETV